MVTPPQFSLRWNNYLRHITLAFDSLRSQEDLVDVTLSCEGRKIRAHKILLSACSSYFREIFKENPCQHPVIIFKNVKYEDLSAIIEFMYQGEVNVVQESLPSFLHTAELLSVQGLTETKEPIQESVPLPKLAKIVPVTLQPSQTTTTTVAVPKPPVPTIIPTARIKLSTSTSEQYIEVQQQQPTVKKQKLSITPDTDTEDEEDDDDQQHHGEEMFIPSKIEYMDTSVKTEQQSVDPISTQQPDDDDAQSGNEHDGQHEADDDDEMGKTYIGESTIEMMEAHVEDGRGGSKITFKKDIALSKSDDMNSEQTTGICASNSQGENVKFRCSICFKGFKHPNSLTLHKDLHNGKTKCPVCSRAFSRSYDMKTHMTKIHKATFQFETKFNITT